MASKPFGSSRKKHFERSAFFNEINPTDLWNARPVWNIATQCEILPVAYDKGVISGKWIVLFILKYNFFDKVFYKQQESY